MGHVSLDHQEIAEENLFRKVNTETRRKGGARSFDWNDQAPQKENRAQCLATFGPDSHGINSTRLEPKPNATAKTKLR